MRSRPVLVALATDSNLSLKLQSMSPELAKIPPEKLQKELPNLLGKSVENDEETTAASAAQPSGAPGPQGGPKIGSKTPSLDQFTTNGDHWAFMRQNSPLSAPWIGEWFAGWPVPFGSFGAGPSISACLVLTTEYCGDCSPK